MLPVGPVSGSLASFVERITLVAPFDKRNTAVAPLDERNTAVASFVELSTSESNACFTRRGAFAEISQCWLLCCARLL